MVYTSGVPQSNQTIAGSRPQIQGNFSFLQDSLRQDHQFNTGAATEGVHKQCSMANQTTPAVPAGTNGVYYVKGGQAWFNNGTVDYQLSINTYLPGFTPFFGSVTIAGGAMSNFTPLISGNVGGYITIFRNDGNYYLGSFYRNATIGQQINFEITSSGNNQPYVIWSGGALMITNTSGSSKTYNYQGWFYPTA